MLSCLQWRLQQHIVQISIIRAHPRGVDISHRGGGGEVGGGGGGGRMECRSVVERSLQLWWL